MVVRKSPNLLSFHKLSWTNYPMFPGRIKSNLMKMQSKASLLIWRSKAIVHPTLFSNSRSLWQLPQERWANWCYKQPTRSLRKGRWDKWKPAKERDQLQKIYRWWGGENSKSSQRTGNENKQKDRRVLKYHKRNIKENFVENQRMLVRSPQESDCWLRWEGDGATGGQNSQWYQKQ